MNDEISKGDGASPGEEAERLLAEPLIRLLCGLPEDDADQWIAETVQLDPVQQYLSRMHISLVRDLESRHRRDVDRILYDGKGNVSPKGYAVLEGMIKRLEAAGGALGAFHRENAEHALRKLIGLIPAGSWQERFAHVLALMSSDEGLPQTHRAKELLAEIDEEVRKRAEVAARYNTLCDVLTDLDMYGKAPPVAVSLRKAQLNAPKAIDSQTARRYADIMIRVYDGHPGQIETFEDLFKLIDDWDPGGVRESYGFNDVSPSADSMRRTIQNALKRAGIIESEKGDVHDFIITLRIALIFGERSSGDTPPEGSEKRPEN